MSDLIDREKLRTWLEARQYVNPTAREDSWNQAMQTAIRGLDALDAAPSPALTHVVIRDDSQVASLRVDKRYEGPDAAAGLSTPGAVIQIKTLA